MRLIRHLQYPLLYHAAIYRARLSPRSPALAWVCQQAPTVITAWWNSMAPSLYPPPKPSLLFCSCNDTKPARHRIWASTPLLVIQSLSRCRKRTTFSYPDRARRLPSYAIQLTIGPPFSGRFINSHTENGILHLQPQVRYPILLLTHLICESYRLWPFGRKIRPL